MLSFSGFSYQRQQERDRKEIKHMKNRLHVKAPGNWVNDPNGMISVSYTHLTLPTIA